MINLPGGAVVVLFVAVIDSFDSGCVSNAANLCMALHFLIIDNPSAFGTL